MFKLLSIVGILATSSTAMAESGLDLSSLHTKQMVRLSLWHGGIQLKSNADELKAKEETGKQYTEELEIALRVLDQ